MIKMLKAHFKISKNADFHVNSLKAGNIILTEISRSNIYSHIIMHSNSVGLYKYIN